MKTMKIFLISVFVLIAGIQILQASNIGVSPSSLDFGLVAQGKGHGLPLNINNNTSSSVTCSVSVQPSLFSLVVQSGAGFSNVASTSLTIAANNRAVLDVAFKPGNSSIGSITQGSLTIACPGGLTSNVPLKGQTGVELDVAKNGNLTGNLIVSSGGTQLLTCSTNFCPLVKDRIIQVSISADPSSSFAGWSNATAGAASCWGQKTPCSFSLSANTNIMGTFGTKR